MINKNEFSTLSTKRTLALIITGVSILLLSILSFQFFEILSADEVMVVQYLNGNLEVFTEPGPKLQFFGSITTFPKLDIYEFEAPVVFNDAGSATLKGSIQWEMPLDKENILEIKTKYGSADAIREGLVNKVVDKCVYMTGPLMSSAESYATKKTDLIRYIEDQILSGVYKTFTKEDKIEDPITGKPKTVKITDIVVNGGIPVRQEEPVLGSLGIRTSNLAIGEIVYSKAVIEQIAKQQTITMEVQTAIADARKAEQNYITITKQGEASAATAKWEQEKVNAQEIAAAEKAVKVAELDKQTAALEKAAKILRAEGDAEYKRKIILADGALEQKLKTYENTVVRSFEHLAKQKLVPDVMFGSNGSGISANGGSNSSLLIEMLSAKTAKDLALELKVK